MSSKSANDNNDEEKQTTLQDDLGSLDTTSLDSQPLGDKAGDDNAFVPGSVKKASHRASERRRRERLSASLTSLETIIRSSKKFSSRKGLKLNKNLLIEYTIDYIKDLEDHLNQSNSKVTFLTQQLNTYQDNQTKLLQSLLKSQSRPPFLPPPPPPPGMDPAAAIPPAVTTKTENPPPSFSGENPVAHPVYASYNNKKMNYGQRNVPILIDPNANYIKADNFNPLFTPQYPSQQSAYLYPAVACQNEGSPVNLVISKPPGVGMNSASTLPHQPYIQANGYIEPVISGPL